MPFSPLAPPYDRFMLTADKVAEERPEVDLEMAREVFHEVATLLYNGLVLDDLDAHDTDAVVDALCVDLVSGDPGAAIRARAEQVANDPGDLHDAPEVAWVYQRCIGLMQL